jgi:hypothetical protein
MATTPISTATPAAIPSIYLREKLDGKWTFSRHRSERQG